MAENKRMLSIVVPLYNEEENFGNLIEKLKEIASKLDVDVEFVFVDDGSADKTFELARAAAAGDSRVRALRLARNYGSHAAIMAGMAASRGDCSLFMAGDMQDPPALITQMLEEWRQGYRLVWAARKHVEQQPFKDRFFSLCYWGLYNLSVDYPVPAGGIDFGLYDKVIVDQIRSNPYSRLPVFAQASDAGFPYSVVLYVKQARAAGKSGWTLRKKFGLVFQTLLMSSKPVRWLCAFAVIGLVISATLSCVAVCLIVDRGALLPVLLSSVIVFHLALVALAVAFAIQAEYMQLRVLEVERVPRYVVAETSD